MVGNPMFHDLISVVVGASAYTIFFKKPHKKKSGLVKSGDLRHHAIGP